MEAQSYPPGAFVLEVANLGKEAVASFTRFITTRNIQERRMENILATLSITTSLLTDLGTTVNKYENDVFIDDDVTRPTCETCKTDLKKLLIITKEAGEKGIWVREGTLGGKPMTAEIDPYFLFNMGLGGQHESAEFFKRLDLTRYSLVALNDTIKYKIFKVLKEQGRLDPDQAEEFKSLTALLPQLVKTIEKAERNKKERIEWETARAERAKKVEKAEKAAKALKSSRKRRDVGEKNETAPQGLERRDSDASSEMTMIEPPQEELIHLKKKGVKFADDDDRRSINSLDSMDESNLLDKEVLEEWLLRWTNPIKDVRASIRLFGIGFKKYHEDPGYWGIDPEMRSQSELQDALHVLTSNTSQAKYRDAVYKAMSGLPELAREVVEELLEDRAKNTSNEKHTRRWTVVAVRPQVKNHFEKDRFFKSAKSQDWLIMIKGETLDRKKRDLTSRWYDPWRKPYPPRARRHPIYDDYYVDERDYNRRPPPMRIPSPPPMPLIEDYRHRRLTRDAEMDGFRPGTIVVGQVPNHEEAERKMDEILTDLPNKFTV